MSAEKEELESKSTQIDANIGTGAKNIAVGEHIYQDNREIYYGSGSPNRPVNKDDLSVEEQEILIAGYMNKIRAAPILMQKGLIVSAGDRGFIGINYERALKKLRNRNLIVLIERGKSSETYELTGLGDEIAESLGATGPAP